MLGSSSDVSHKTMTPRDTRDIATAIIDKTAAAPACTAMHLCIILTTSAANRSIGSTTGFTITEKAPTRAFSWLKAPSSAFTFKTQC